MAVLGLAVAAGGCAAPEATFLTPSGTAPTGVERGKRVFLSREQGHCVLCHSVPGVAEAGNVGPALAGVGSRLTADEIRYRIEDITRINPQAVMPAFRRIDGLQRVVPVHADRPILSAPQLEDLVDYLASLK